MNKSILSLPLLAVALTACGKKKNRLLPPACPPRLPGSGSCKTG